MRILYVAAPSSPDAVGGIETYGRSLIAGIAGRGHQVELVETTPDRVYRHAWLGSYWPARPFRERYYFWKRVPCEDYRYHQSLRNHVRQRVRSFRPDIIHALHLHPFGAIASVEIPVVVSAYGLEVQPIPPVLGSVRRADAIHAISRFTAELIRTQLMTERAVTVLSWGVRPISEDADHVRERDFDLITVARLVRRKNVDTILRAIRTLGDPPYAVVGDGPDIAGLRELSKSLGLTNTHFFGAVSEAERKALLARSRLFVMCPRISAEDVEGLGLVYFEALEAGLPIVASNNGGVPDAVGTAGLLVNDPEDVQEVAQAIRAALDRPAYENLVSQVRQRQKNNSWEAFLANFEQLYRTVAASRRQ